MQGLGDERMKQPGMFVATGSRDKTIRLWDAYSGQCLKVLIGHDNWIRALVFHPSGKYLLSASDDHTIRVWDLTNGGRTIKTIQAHDHFVTSMAWGRATVGAANGDAKSSAVNGASDVKRKINVLATGSVDLTIRVSQRQARARVLTDPPFEQIWAP